LAHAKLHGIDEIIRMIFWLLPVQHERFKWNCVILLNISHTAQPKWKYVEEKSRFCDSFSVTILINQNYFAHICPEYGFRINTVSGVPVLGWKAQRRGCWGQAWAGLRWAAAGRWIPAGVEKGQAERLSEERDWRETAAQMLSRPSWISGHKKKSNQKHQRLFRIFGIVFKEGGN